MEWWKGWPPPQGRRLPPPEYPGRGGEGESKKRERERERQSGERGARENKNQNEIEHENENENENGNERGSFFLRVLREGGVVGVVEGLASGAAPFPSGVPGERERGRRERRE